MAEPQAVDKELLYGKYQAMEDKKAALAMKAAHKALDIADDEMNIQANQTHNHTNQGIGAKGVAGIAVAAGLPAVVAAALILGGTPSIPQEKGAKESPTKEVTKDIPGKDKVITLPGKDSEYDAIYEVKQPDGTWKQIRRERLVPGKPSTP